MSKEPRPIDPLRHEFVASLEKYMHETGRLLDAVETAVSQGAVTGGMGDLLSQCVIAVRHAQSGDAD